MLIDDALGLRLAPEEDITPGAFLTLPLSPLSLIFILSMFALSISLLILVGDAFVGEGNNPALALEL